MKMRLGSQAPVLTSLEMLLALAHQLRIHDFPSPPTHLFLQGQPHPGDGFYCCLAQRVTE